MIFSRIKNIGVISWAACAVVLALCGAVTSLHAKPAKVKVQTCELLAMEEIGKAIGKPALSMMDVPLSSDMGACTYFSDATKTVLLVSTQLHTKGGPKHYSLYCETTSGSIKPGEPIAGLGDQACLRDKSALFLRKGDKLIMVTIAVMGDVREPLIKLGRAALVKL
ncbi:MAG: hypothetical protein EAZ43_07610 [Betaproteobacteria bacterium]|nr:MAG: hypothetical protein EAZ43_07610 [Betaproteobacteria bacterium]